MNTSAPTPRTRIQRIAENARYDAATLHAILDAGYLCHIAFADPRGTHCIPMAYWREGEHVYIHGSNGGRLIKTLAAGTQVCLSVSHLDGLVLARSAFNHSMNYRTALVYGVFEPIHAPEAKRAHMDAFMRQLAPGREQEARSGNAKEIAATTVLRLSLAEAACKVRSGPPMDDAEDMALPVWTGVLPFSHGRAAPVPEPGNPAAAPRYVERWQG